ncbi:unnamed protein product [Durusdinium trenchii]|uniref:Uncharacterized protein n=1 Tax=Durusdinium trenchii TaxID=1381693 RepID=A0ABP0SMK3_9DINO
MDQPYGIPSCVHSIILWLVPNTVLPQWCCACTSTAEVAEAHPCWQHRSLQCFGGELLELRFTGGSAWRKLYGRLALAINHLRLGKPTLREGLRFETSAAAWDLELQWSLVVPTPQLEAAAVLSYDGASCRFCDMVGEKVEALRAVIATDCIFLLANSRKIDIYDFNGQWTGELLQSSEEVDLLRSTSDMFLADGQLILEQPTRLLLWDCTSQKQRGVIRPTPSWILGQEERLCPLQARPAGSSLALWAEEGGHSIQFWSIESLRLLTQWSPFTRLDQTLMTFGVSVGEQLLLAVDSAEMLHVACMESKGVVDLMAIPLFMEGGRSILPCSVAVRCGMLSFVEATGLEAHQRTLHVWRLASNGDILPVPRRCSFPFTTGGQAAVSVPKPILGHFVLLKTCSVIEGDDPYLSVAVFDAKQEVLLYHVATSAQDSTLFRRSHPLSDLILGFWVSGPSETRSLHLYNLAKPQVRQVALSSSEASIRSLPSSM